LRSWAKVLPVPAAPTYELPPSAIAQSPIEPRDAARLLVAGPPTQHLHVRDLPTLLEPGDIVVVNETRVLPARLHLQKASGGAVEVLLLEDLGDDEWLALVKPGRRVPEGTRVASDGLAVHVGKRLEGGKRRVRLDAGGGDVAAALARRGQVPLPPYITTPLADPERYQTVYSSTPGSVAAPTAGLHLTPSVLDAVRARGVEVRTVDLHVGLDTFRPVTADRIEDHEVHEEAYVVPEETLDACRSATGRVVAIGTTTVRALESAAATGQLGGRTRLLITPGHEWQLVDALLTNFHMPSSTLLLLVEAFVGPRWRELYDVALAEGYRFLSFGDAMFLERSA